MKLSNSLKDKEALATTKTIRTRLSSRWKESTRRALWGTRTRCHPLIKVLETTSHGSSNSNNRQLKWQIEVKARIPTMLSKSFISHHSSSSNSNSSSSKYLQHSRTTIRLTTMKSNTKATLDPSSRLRIKTSRGSTMTRLWWLMICLLEDLTIMTRLQGIWLTFLRIWCTRPVTFHASQK
mgnify:CR=1 FL=1